MHCLSPSIKAVAGLVLLLCAVQTSAVKITYEGSVGCAAIAPEGPSNLKAYPGSEKVRLVWSAPGNNACVDEYVVDIKQISRGYKRSFTPWEQSLKTQEYQTTIEGLENGEHYEFTVRAVAHVVPCLSCSSHLTVSWFQGFKDRDATTTVTASPKRVCRRMRPGYITNLHATPGDGYVKVCWDGVDNDACVSEYKVRTRVKTDHYRHQYDHPEEISKGGCVKIAELSNSVKYEFSVMGYHQHSGLGIPTYIVAAPRHRPHSDAHHSYHHSHDHDDDDHKLPFSRPRPYWHHEAWKCHSIPNSYPRCEAHKRKLCKEMTCQQQAAVGNCDAPFMQHVDYETKTMTQFCSKHCPCPKSPSNKTASRFLFLDDYCCKKPNISHKIKKPLKSLRS